MTQRENYENTLKAINTVATKGYPELLKMIVESNPEIIGYLKENGREDYANFLKSRVSEPAREM